MRRRLRTAYVLALGSAAIVAVAGCGGSDDEKKSSDDDLQTVSFQKPTEAGPDPFTEPADVEGEDTVSLEPTGGSSDSGGGDTTGRGPFGGSGSDLVCDRELLIKSLLRDPEKMREWARVLRIDPTPEAVSRYIRKLRPSTLTQDTPVTNHNFVNGKAVGYQAILAKGTAVLVDEYGKPVVRCRCGNPLLEPIPYEKIKCHGCPPHYRPPKPCYYDYPHNRRPKGFEQDEEFSPPQYDYSRCYEEYPNPPPVRESNRPEQEPEPPPAAESQFEPEPEPEPQTQTQTQTEPEPYCYEADSPDRFEPGCQGTYGPPPQR